ncbi:ATP-binding protein [Paraflavisolibacter sp. H34]|uniref:ATP-binding protein n=1 Tax=Huijunlia imazamoxiresistens TaxID=3127457 RepID=UPI0030191324
MQKIFFKYLALWGFLIGILFIVFLQFISGRNINRLIQGNKSLLHELAVQNNLQKVQFDIIRLESDVRGAVISGNGVFLEDVNQRITGVETAAAGLKDLQGMKANRTEVDLLHFLIREKLQFTRQLITTYQSTGKAAAEKLVSTNRGKVITDSLNEVISKLYSDRQGTLQRITASNEKNGQQARTWGLVLAAMACLFLIIVFLYITNQSAQQQRMIANLNQSERKIKEAARLKEQFMANMSHEIRTPMNSIIGFTNLLKRTNLNDSQRQYVQNIHSAGENLLVLVNDILDLSKIESGMMHLEETNFSLRSLISSIGAMFIERIKEKKLELKIEVASETPDILCGDAIRLTQVLVNLLSNAVKFTERGGITIVVTSIYCTEERARLRLVVEDTGIGIAREKQAAVFERFQQADSETTRKFGGTGLGLSIVKQLVQLQKGSIELQSEPGRGSKFTVELEFKIPDANEMLSNAIAAEAATPVKLDTIKVLIAEDNTMNQQLIRHLMKSWNIECTLVNNGAEALEALKRQSFSLVLMDIQMPVMDGYTATGIIRNELHMDIPIIAMTAHAMIGEKEKCMQLGMNDYVSKPIKETVLYNMIAQYSHYNASPGHHRDEAPNHHEPAFRYIRLNYLHELSGNDEEFERAMMEQFAKQTPSELGELQEAIDASDFVAIRKVAHSLKSTVGYMGLASELHPYLEKIEKSAVGQSMTEVRSSFDHVRTVTQNAIGEVEKYLAL